MNQSISGIHHVTAIAGDPQQNIDFYTGFLGLRLVKLTVNFDDPQTYHFYYGNAVGEPGTIMTFFSWPGAFRGRRGTGQVITTSFSIPRSAVDFWLKRCRAGGIPVSGPVRRLEEEVLAFQDPDGLHLELVALSGDERLPWTKSPIPAEFAIRGLYSVTLSEESHENTAQLLTETLRFDAVAETSQRVRYQTKSGGPGTVVDVQSQPHGARSQNGLGTVHHVAWRTPNDEQQSAWHRELVSRKFQVTPVMDRCYFHSIYFREPGGVLFEIATDRPGFTVDQAPEELGTRLKLPPWLEYLRPQLESTLPPLRLTPSERSLP